MIRSILLLVALAACAGPSMEDMARAFGEGVGRGYAAGGGQLTPEHLRALGEGAGAGAARELMDRQREVDLPDAAPPSPAGELPQLPKPLTH